MKKKLKSVQRSIPYSYCHMDGTIETKPGHFTRTYRLEDVNFAIASEDTQLQIYKSFQGLLSVFSSEAQFQIFIQNSKADDKETLHNIRYEHKGSSPHLNGLRNEFNEVLVDRLSKGKNSLRQQKYLVISVKDSDAKNARMKLDTYDHEINEAIRLIAGNSEIRTEHSSLEERLRTIHDTYNPGGFWGNVENDDGSVGFSISEFVRSGKQTKDMVAPSGLLFEDNYFKTGETYGRSMYLNSIPMYLGAEYMVGLSNMSVEMIISMHYQPIDQGKANKMVSDQLRNIKGEISDAERHAALQGYSLDLIPDSMEESLEMTKDLLNDLSKRDQKLFQVTIVVTVFGDSLRDLEEKCRVVKKYSEKKLCPLSTLLYQQEEGLNSSLPLCVNQIKASRLMTTETAAIFIPYTSQELFMKGGLYYGVNQITNNIIMHNRLAGKNYNAIYFGESGTGKSFLAKQEMLSALCRSDDNYVYVIDPQGEYGGEMLELTKGEELIFSATSRTYLNPMDMDVDYSGDSNPVAGKSDYLIGMIEMIHGAPLSQKERSIVDRCVQNVYAGYLVHMNELWSMGKKVTIDRDATPILSKLYNEIKSQPEQEAQDIAALIEMYSIGNFATFSHRSTVDTDKRYVTYNIRDLGGMREIGLYICLNDIWNKVIENRKKNRWTWIYIDELWILLKSESTTKFLMNIWKTARKWQGVPTGITQNTGEFLETDMTRSLLNNTSFVVMNSASYEDRERFKEWFNIPDTQLAYITNSPRGMGLIYTDTTILPFNDKYAKNTILYKAASTSNDIM